LKLLLKTFFPIFIAVSIVIGVLNHLNIKFLHDLIWILQGYFLGVALISSLISSKGLKYKEDFHLYYMGTMVMRFFFHLIIIFICFYLKVGNEVILVVNFFILYLLYTSFEIYHLLRNLRPDFKSNGTTDKIS